MFTHFLITRFAIQVPEWGTSIDDAWLEHRLSLFERYTLPSVVNQTNQNFDWFLLVDHSISEEYLMRLEKHKRCYVFIVSDWLDDIQEFFMDVVDTDWLITTRLDNDDIIAPWVINRIQMAAKRKEQWLDFPHGYTLKDGVFRLKQEYCNPFLSYVEPVAKCKTAYYLPHGRAVKQTLKTKTVMTDPSWIQVIHEQNKSNKADGTRVDPKGWLLQYV